MSQSQPSSTPSRAATLDRAQDDSSGTPDSAGPPDSSGTPSATAESTDQRAESPAESPAVSGSSPAPTGSSDPAGGSSDPADAGGPLGPAGPRFSRTSPFYVGLVGGLGVLVAIALGTMIAEARAILMLIVVALYLAMGLEPIVSWFVRHRMRRGVGVLAVFLGMVGAFGLIVLAIIPVVTKQVTALAGQVPVWFAQLRHNQSILEFDQKYQVTQRVQDYLTGGELAKQAAGGLIGFGVVVFSAVFAAFTLLVLTLYFLGSLPSILGAVYRLVPASRRERVTFLGGEIVGRIGRYVGGQLLVAAFAGMMSFVFLEIVGLGEYAVALAVAVMLFDLIPLVGGAVSAVVVTSIGFLSAVPIGIACAIYYVVYQQIENYVIMPRVMTRAVSVPGTVVVVAALLGGSLFGMVGALLAVPTAAAVLLVVREVVVPRQDAS